MTEQTAISKQQIVADLRRLGLHPGAIVLVHSSLRSLGCVEGGADTVIDALLESVSPGGSIIVPTLTGTEEDSPEHPPAFDPAKSPCWTGTIPETFRRRNDAVRSAHPTHSVAVIGPDAWRLTADHERSETPCAADSPYGRLADARGQGYILLIGVTHESNTSLHMLEEMAHVPYHMQQGRAPARVRRQDGTWDTVPIALHLWRWDRNFPKIDPILLDAGAQRDGYVGKAYCRLIAAGSMRDVLLPILRADPLFLLSDDARVEFEQSTPTA